jgi:hypothetical protein
MREIASLHIGEISFDRSRCPTVAADKPMAARGYRAPGQLDADRFG